MSKEKQSYSEKMKAAAMKRHAEKNEGMLSLYISMFWHEVWLNYRCEDLNAKIDDALDRGDRERFNELANEKRRLMEFFGT